MIIQSFTSKFTVQHRSWVKFLSLVVMTTFFLQPFIALATSPAAQDIAVSMNEDTVKMITLRAGSTNRTETLTYAIVALPTHGSVSLSDKVATYTPAANYAGTDSFTYTATGSSTGVSNVATVAITIAAVNDAPVATSNITATTQKNIPVNVQLSGTDVDSDPLTCSAVSATMGTFTVNSGTCVGTYTPATNATGTGTATFKVYDGKIYSPAVSVSITVQATNAAPVAQNLSMTTIEDVSVSTRFSATDSDNDALTFAVVGNPAHGTVSVSGATVTYTGAGNYNGTDSFTYQANDGKTVSNTATVSLTVTPGNDAPTASAVNTSTNNLSPVTVTMLGNDIDGDTLSYKVVGFPTSGTLGTVSGNQVAYVPASSFAGMATFTYQVSDGKFSANGTVTILVGSIPVAYPLVAETVINEAVNIVPSGSDLDGGEVTLALTTQPLHGTLTAQTQGWRYTPASGYVGMDTFTYSANDGTYTSAPAIVRVNVNPVTGIAGVRIVQAGVNFLDIGGGAAAAPAWLYPIIHDLGIQAVRQVGGGDSTWTQVLQSNGTDVSSAATAAQLTAQANGVQVVHTLFEYKLASCTSPWNDFTDPAQFVRTFDSACENYLSHVSTAINTSNPQVAPVLVEIGNEMFHWVEYDSTLNYTPEEQAAVLLASSNYLRTHVSNVRVVAPSIMFSDATSGDWESRVNAAIGTDWFDVQTVHFYDEWQSARDEIKEYYANHAVAGKLWSVTETGRSSDPTGTRTKYNTEEKKIAAVPQNFSLLMGAGATSMYWHAFIEGQENDANFRGMGLIDAETGAYEQAAYAYKFMTQELVPFDQVLDRSVDSTQTFVYEFRTAAGTTKQVAWGAGTYVVPVGFTQMASFTPPVAGAVYTFTSVTPGQIITLENMPVLLK